MFLVIYLLISQSHEDLEGMSLMQHRQMCKQKGGLKSKSWDRNRLLKLIAGTIVKSATNPVYIHLHFNMHCEIPSSFNIYTFLGTASSSEPPISQVTPPEAEGGRMARSLSFSNKGEKLREKTKLPALKPCSSFCFC
jgi:hypothetical protein